MDSPPSFKMILTIILTAVVILIAIAVAILTKPLPPWNGLYGEEYKKWKRGEKAKSDNSD